MFNNFLMPDFRPAAPEILLLTLTCGILFADLLFGAKHRWVVALLSTASLIACAALTVYTLAWDPVLTFSNMYVSDLMASLLKLLTYISVIAVIIYSRGYLKARDLDKGEFYLLVLFATLGMMVMISAASLLTLYLGVELLSLSQYALVALDRKSARATEAAMKYFVLGALASGLLLYGMSMLYGATGSLELGNITQAAFHENGNHIVLAFGMVFIVAGIGFKLGVVPFHMWIPDVYEGAPTAVTLFLASAPKFAAYAMAIRLLVSGLMAFAEQWQVMLLMLAVLSIGLGNLAAIAQTNFKRMLAYSAISHMGFMLLALACGVRAGGDSAPAIAAYTSAMYYVVAYVLSSLGSFGMILLLSRAGFEAENLDDFRGLNKRSSWFALMGLIFMFSMAGIPFFIGFFAKFTVLSMLVATGHTGIAVFAVIFSLIGAFYYLRVVKLMYFDAPEDHAPLQTGMDMRLLLSANGLAVALLGIFPQPVMNLCQLALVGSFTR
jgi:NADH-quinone oxidoreductase subunit N